MDIASLRHEREKPYQLAALAAGVVIWGALILGTLGLVLIPVALGLWITGRLMRVVLFGHALRVSDRQLPEIDAIVRQCAGDMNLTVVPMVFVVDSGSRANALAIRLLRDRYVILYSHLVDMLDQKGLGMVIAHELAHHAAGHVNFWTSTLAGPSRFVPFVGAAYARARELTADRMAAAWLGDPGASKAALAALSCGSLRFAGRLDWEAFREQEASIPAFFGFLHMLFARHPRLTRRIMELDKYFQGAVQQGVPVARLAE